MCFGPLKRLCHWGPLTALGIIKIISLMTIHCNTLWWSVTESYGGMINSSMFLLFSALTIYNMLASVYEGPGYLPLKWVPINEEDKKYLQFCVVCQGYKAPRSHHCKKCGKCVMKMDHHCPWINNCVGHKNHCNFTWFLFFAVCGCIQASVVLTYCTYKALYKTWYLYYGEPSQKLISMELHTFIACVFALGLSVGVVLAVGMLFVFQMRSILRNRTAIEDWILEKAEHRRVVAESQGEVMKPFVFPYNLGKWENFKMVFNMDPCVRGDGITWPVRKDVPDCDQYYLTREQMEQKTEKRQRTKAYTCVRQYSGRWLPVVHGWRALCTVPCTDEYRLPLVTGDYLLVTRWRRHWLFGEKSTPDGDNRLVGKRGWFPRCCVISVTGDVTADKKTD